MKVTKMIIDKPLIRVTRDVDKLREENKKQKEVLDKIKEYIKEKDLTNNMNFMDDGIGNLFKDILELLEEIE